MTCESPHTPPSMSWKVRHIPSATLKNAMPMPRFVLRRSVAHWRLSSRGVRIQASAPDDDRDASMLSEAPVATSPLPRVRGGASDYLNVRNVSIAYAGRDANIILAIDRIDLTVDRGKFVCLLGPSGCGKTTLLNAVAGFLAISSGDLTLKGKPIERPGPDRAMVFQQPGLLPWRDVLHNVTYGLEMSGRMRGRAAAAHARALLELVGLADFAHSFPHKRIPSLIAGLVVQDSYIKAHP